MSPKRTNKIGALKNHLTSTKHLKRTNGGQVSVNSIAFKHWGMGHSVSEIFARHFELHCVAGYIPDESQETCALVVPSSGTAVQVSANHGGISVSGYEARNRGESPQRNIWVNTQLPCFKKSLTCRFRLYSITSTDNPCSKTTSTPISILTSPPNI